MNNLPTRIGIQQRVLPVYRGVFFDALALEQNMQVSIFSGMPHARESLGKMASLEVANHYQANNLHILKNRFYLCLQTNIHSWLKEWDPKVLIVEANPRYLHLKSAIRWMHNRHRPVIGWGLGVPRQDNSISNRVKHAWLKQFDALLTYSEQGKSEYSALGFPTDKIYVAPNAVTHQAVNPAPARSDSATGNDLIVLFVGRLQARKQIHLLINACAALDEKIQPRLEIVGEGPERQRLEELAMKMYPRTVFHGAKYGTELDSIYRSADLFVLPGTGGLAVQQAMAFALPVIVAEADGTQADLVRESNGWLIRKGNEDALREALTTALSDTHRLRVMGMVSYQIVQNEVNIEIMVKQFLAAIHSVRDKTA